MNQEGIVYEVCSRLPGISAFEVDRSMTRPCTLELMLQFTDSQSISMWYCYTWTHLLEILQRESATSGITLPPNARVTRIERSNQRTEIYKSFLWVDW